MRLKIRQDTDKLFEDNGWLTKHDVFVGMNEEEVIFTALVADFQSPFNLLEEKRRRENASRCVDHKYRTEWVKGTNKRIEKAIKYYIEHINPSKTKMIKRALDGYVKQHDAVSDLISTANVSDGEDKDELNKQKLAMQAIKDGSQKKIWELIEYYENLLGHQYEPPAEVKDDMKGGDGASINEIDIARI